MEDNMNYNFELLKKRVLDTNNVSDLKLLKTRFNELKGKTICIGVGGSNVVAKYAQKVIAKVSGDIVICSEPRDLLYFDSKNFENLLIVSYSGKGKAVGLGLNNNLKKYLFSNNEIKYDNVTNITYSNTIPEENSFISLASTLMPMSILLNWYLSVNGINFSNIIEEMFDVGETSIKNSDVYEIFGGIENSVSMKYLESTLTESGIAIPLIHDKYEYCHGRSTISYKNNNGLIYIDDKNTQLDKLLLLEARKYYSEIIKIDGFNDKHDEIIDEFFMTVKAMYLTKKLAENKQEDLSKVKHSPLVYKLYNFNGTM